MLEYPDVQSRDFAEALDAIYLKSPKLDADELLKALDEVERAHIQKIAESHEQHEIRRRVAESKLKLLSERNLPAERVDPLYQQICDLGFTDMLVEATIQIYFAQYCVRSSRVEEARQVIDALCQKLQQDSSVDNPEFYADLLRDARRVLP